jgi:GMP synthase-like glutamine amidotransferase
VRVLSLLHEADAPSGIFGDAVRDGGGELLEWTAPNGPPPEDPEAFDAVFLFGGAMHVDDEERHPWLRQEDGLLKGLLATEVPTFGVCLGGQLLAKAAGARVGPASQEEVGWHEVALTSEARGDPIFGGLPERFEALQWHSYAFELPPGAVALATSPICLQAYRLGERAWGVQFHPEVDVPILEGWLRYPEARGRSFDLAPMESWSRLGRGLVERFLALAAQRPPRSRRAATRAS